MHSVTAMLEECDEGAAMPAIIARGLNKHFSRDRAALKDINLQVDEGEMVALIGASGSGKSTLIRHLAGLVAADRNSGEGLVEILGQCVQRNGQIRRGVRRARARTGVIFQQFNLVNRLSLLKNTCLGVLGRIPAWRGNWGLFNRKEKLLAMKALHRVGVDGFAGQRASTLSGGQQQRGAIARALVQGAEIMIADEPIASLDPKSARDVMNILETINKEDGITVVVSLHQVEYAIRYCPRTIALRDGSVVFDGPSSALTPEFLAELYGSESESLFLPGVDQEQGAKRRDVSRDDVAAVAFRSPLAAGGVR